MYYFEYDEKGRVTSVRTEDPEADGTNEITYGDGTVTIYTTGEDGYEETSVFTLNEAGNVESYTYENNEGESSKGTIVYDADDMRSMARVLPFIPTVTLKVVSGLTRPNGKMVIW